MSKRIRCAIYTRKSTEEGLEQEFNSLDAQREACEAFIQSQRGLGWVVGKKRYDDGGHSGGTMERPALKALLGDIERGKVDLVVVYKVDRFTRSLMDFAKIIESFDARGVSFVSVTQQFNTANSMGRLTLNVLLSFAQFEREVTAERIRDKIAASKKKGMWMGGLPPLGYDVEDKKLVVNVAEADVVRTLFNLYLEIGSVRKLKKEADRRKFVTKRRNHGGRLTGGRPFSRGHLYWVLHNPIYVGEVAHKGQTYPGQHEAIVDRATWETVEKMLGDHAPARRLPTNIKQGCVLTGIVFDENGDRLSPTYAKKNGRRYRYYTSKKSAHENDEKGTGWRIPSKELEGAVAEGIRNFLRDQRRVIDSVGVAGAPPDDQQNIIGVAAELAEVILRESPDQNAEKFRKLIDRVDLGSEQIRIMISPRGLSELVGAGNRIAEDAPPLSFEIPVSFRRRGVESKIVIGGENQTPLAPDVNLIQHVRRSHDWWRLFTEGEVGSVQELAEHASIDASDVTRFLPFAFLAPDIVEKILDGGQPIELNVERLKKVGPIPADWNAQRRLLGFAE